MGGHMTAVVIWGTPYPVLLPKLRDAQVSHLACFLARRLEHGVELHVLRVDRLVPHGLGLDRLQLVKHGEGQHLARQLLERPLVEAARRTPINLLVSSELR